MRFSDYIFSTECNIKEAFENGDYDCLLEDGADAQDIYDEMFVDDSITGNASGSYTFNATEAEEYTAELVWDDEFLMHLEDMGYGLDVFKRGAETVDVIARCFALSYCMDTIESCIEEWHEEHDEDEEDEDEEE